MTLDAVHLCRFTTIAALSLAACGGESPRGDDPGVADENVAGDETRAAPELEAAADDEERTAAAAPSPCDAPGSAPPRAAAPFDPATLTGYVSGDQAPMGEGHGRVITIRLTPHATVATTSELAFCVEESGEARPFRVYVPHGFPVPFVEGQAIAFEGGATGGGPNHRATMLVRDDAGALLLAVGAIPTEMNVEEGRRVRSEPASGYREYVHEVVFTPRGAAPTRLAPNTWGRVTTTGGDFLLWGDAHRRELRRNTPPPPDYVAGWLDFAIVRAP